MTAGSITMSKKTVLFFEATGKYPAKGMTKINFPTTSKSGTLKKSSSSFASPFVLKIRFSPSSSILIILCVTNVSLPPGSRKAMTSPAVVRPD